MTRSRGPRRLVLALLAVVLAGCSASGGGPGSRVNEVSAIGVSFDAPEGWQQMDPGEADVDSDVVKELAEGLGTTPDQFAQNMKSVDLFVVDDAGARDGFLANINMLDQPGRLPEDDQFEDQFRALGAEVVDLTHEEADVGDVVVVGYTLRLQDHAIEGISYLFDQDDQVVTVTVSTLDRQQSETIGGRILDTLAETS